MRIEYAALTDIGLIRKTNEDAYLIEKRSRHSLLPNGNDAYLLGVADGLGGHACGEIASNIACRELAGIVDEIHSLRPDVAEKCMREKVFGIDKLLRLHAAQQISCLDMGTTLSAIALLRKEAVIVHVGDSRIYRLRRGNLKKLTTDHSLVQELLDEGSITEDIAANHPFRNKLTRVVGTGEPLEALETSRCAIAPDDRYLLCTDGLYGDITSDEIAAILSSSLAPQEAAEKLLNLALQRGGHDNATAIVAYLT
ncbi:MAG: PP2C family serine/threonine-protein phosphatase [Desulfopila sp.]